MSVTGVSSSGSSTSTNTNVTKDLLDKDVFLKILTVQMSNQDPLNPKDNSESIAQLAQFAALEQSKNMNSNMEKMLLSQKLNTGTSMVGQNVQFDIDDKSTVELVKGVALDNGAVYLLTDSGEYNIDYAVGAAPSEKSTIVAMNNMFLSQRFVEGNSMIGKNVVFTVDKSQSTELVSGVKIVNGTVYLVTDKGQRNIDTVVGVGAQEVAK